MEDVLPAGDSIVLSGGELLVSSGAGGYHQGILTVQGVCRSMSLKRAWKPGSLTITPHAAEQPRAESCPRLFHLHPSHPYLRWRRLLPPPPAEVTGEAGACHAQQGEAGGFGDGSNSILAANEVVGH